MEGRRERGREGGRHTHREREIEKERVEHLVITLPRVT